MQCASHKRKTTLTRYSHVQDRKKKDQVNQEIAIIVRVHFPDDAVELDPLEEIQGLAETAGAIVMAGVVQRLSLIHI